MKEARLPPKRVLVPVDFSELGFAAWELAKELRRRLGCELEALHVYERPLIAEPSPTYGCLPLSGEEEKRLCERLAPRLGHGERAFVAEGLPADEILAHARDADVDLVVMGTHGRTGLSRLLFGSVAEAVMRRSPVPILTVRESWRPIRRVFAPDELPERARLAARRLAEALGARVGEVEDPDLIVIGTASGRLPASSPVPVLAVPDVPTEFTAPK